jgi:hypothetical protein
MMSSEDGVQMNDMKSVNALERLFRTMLCTMFMLVFWLVVIWLLYEHDNKLVIILLCFLWLMMIYILASICFIIFITNQFTQTDTENDENECEMTEQEEQQSTLMDSLGSKVDTQSGLFAYPFDHTPNRIRECQDFANPNNSPSHGTYKIVCNAIAFGKQLRSEGTLHLTFTPFGKDRLHNTGWEIKGSSVFGNRAVTISDGFVNAKGHIYWTIPFLCTKQNERRNKQPLKEVTIYRGKWDFDNKHWEDGEFQSIQEASNLSTGSEGRHEGRIVRMEFQAGENDEVKDIDYRRASGSAL